MRTTKNETAAYPGVQADHLEIIPAPIQSAATQPEQQQKATPGSHQTEARLNESFGQANQSAGAGRQQP